MRQCVAFWEGIVVAVRCTHPQRLFPYRLTRRLMHDSSIHSSEYSYPFQAHTAHTHSLARSFDLFIRMFSQKLFCLTTSNGFWQMSSAIHSVTQDLSTTTMLMMMAVESYFTFLAIRIHTKSRYQLHFNLIFISVYIPFPIRIQHNTILA